MLAAERQWNQALHTFNQLSDYLAHLGFVHYRAQVLVDWANVHLLRGEESDIEQARKLLEEARKNFDDMGVAYYVRQVDVQLERI